MKLIITDETSHFAKGVQIEVWDEDENMIFFWAMRNFKKDDISEVFEQVTTFIDRYF